MSKLLARGFFAIMKEKRGEVTGEGEKNHIF